MSTVPENRSRGRFERLLKKELRRARLSHWVGSLPWVKLGQGGTAIVFALIIHLRPPRSAAGGEDLAALFWTLILIPVLLSLIWPWRRLPTTRRLLREVEARQEKSQVLETAADHAAGRLANKGYSDEILDSVLLRAVDELSAGLPPAPRASGRLWLAGAVTLVLALALMLIPSRAAIRPIHLLLMPGETSHYEERARLEVLPGDVELLAGGDLEIEARAHDLPWRFPGTVRMEFDETGDLPVELPLERVGDGYRYRMKDIRQNFSYRFSRERWQGDWHRVEVYHPPVVDSLALAAIAPAYTGLPRRALDLNSGELSLPEGSRVELSARASSELSQAWLLLEDADSLRLQVDGTSIRGDFPLDGDRRLALSLRDLHGIENRTPWLLTLRARADQPPEVMILAPDADAELSRDLRVLVDILAVDDYGVAEMILRACVLGRDDTLTIPVPLTGDAVTRRAERVRWNLEGMQLFPGDLVEYWAETRDNFPGGGQRARSAVHRLRLPSLRDLFEEIEREDIVRGDMMDELLQEGRDMQEDLRELEETLRADPEIDWEKEEKLREAYRRQEDLTEELSELARKMQQSLEEMNSNELLRNETAEKLEKIQKMMEELSGSEAGEILRRFEEMLAEMDPDTLPEDLAELRLDQEALLEQLERTEALLESILREQKMDALLQQADELLQKQEQLSEESESAESSEEAEGEDDESKESLADRQESLADETEELEEKVSETAEEIAEDFPETAEELSKPEESPSEPMRDAAEQMREESAPSPGDQQQEATRRLLKLYWRIVQAQSSMQSQMNSEALEGLEQVTRDALEFSGRVESGRDGLEALDREGHSQDDLARAARRQMDLYRILERLRAEMLEIAATTLAVSPIAIRESARAERSLEASVAELEGLNAGAGLGQSNQTLRSMNLAVVELLHGVQQMGQGGGSCSNPLGQMQSMLQQQEQLNKQSKGMKDQMGKGGLTPEQRAGMQRLRAEQEAVRRGLEELGGDEGEVLGRLDRIMEEMREVEKDLEGGRLSDETLRRQDKIFENLLDAQRSLHRQDFKRERKSESGEDLAPLWPGPGGEDDALRSLRDAIRRGLGEDLPPEYEDLIREYYRGLLEEERRELRP